MPHWWYQNDHTSVVFQLTQDIQVRSNESQREGRKKEKIDRELKQAKADMDSKVSEIKSMSFSIERYKQDVGKLEQSLKEQRVRSFSSLCLVSICGDECKLHSSWWNNGILNLFNPNSVNQIVVRRYPPQPSAGWSSKYFVHKYE
jgi:aspartokinase